MSTDNKTIFQFLMWVNACELSYKLKDITPAQPLLPNQPLTRSAIAGQRK
jgi:hypothetical protein